MPTLSSGGIKSSAQGRAAPHEFGGQKAGIGHRVLHSVVAHEQHGLFGGFLLLNRTGRPLEFHCTAPIRPNRAQDIFYGTSLESYLYGEAIGSTLLAKASCPIDFLCVENPAAWR